MRSRSPAQRAPKTDAEALALAQRRAVLDAEVEAHEAARTTAIAATNAGIDALTVPAIAEIRDIDKQLKVWWPGAAERLTGGKRKSTEFGGCVLGLRTTPPRLAFPGNDQAMVDAVLATGSRRLRALVIRTKLAPEKPILLKLLGIGDALATKLKALGFSAKQKLVEQWPDHFTPAQARAAVGKPIEIAGRAYGGRMGNAPYPSRDGWLFRGRGALQLTGRRIYAFYAELLGLPLLTQPDLAADPATSLAIAVAFWEQGRVNAAVDDGDFAGARRITNVGNRYARRRGKLVVPIGLAGVAAKRARLLPVLAA